MQGQSRGMDSTLINKFNIKNFPSWTMDNLHRSPWFHVHPAQFTSRYIQLMMGQIFLSLLEVGLTRRLTCSGGSVHNFMTAPYSSTQIYQYLCSKCKLHTVCARAPINVSIPALSPQHNGSKCQKPAKNQIEKFVKFTGHTCSCNDLTSFEYQVHGMIGNGSYLNMPKPE